MYSINKIGTENGEYDEFQDVFVTYIMHFMQLPVYQKEKENIILFTWKSRKRQQQNKL